LRVALPETWLVGGIPSPMSAVSALLVVRELAGTRQIVPVVPLREGWQELEIADLDHDGRTEVWTTWQVGSGGYLSVLVHRWDGEQVTLAMSHENAYQGRSNGRTWTAPRQTISWFGRLWGTAAAGPGIIPFTTC